MGAGIGFHSDIMRALIQRSKQASVTIAGEMTACITHGLVVLLGVENDDTAEDAEWLAGKIAQMRIFSDAEGKMNLNVSEVRGSALVVSQFTLHASTKKGNRPGFTRAARPEQAIPLYEHFITTLVREVPVKRGTFGADMQVALINDGPVTIWMDSRAKE
jgi:D-tyrosyl-tRNA(Tyr) deacylase